MKEIWKDVVGSHGAYQVSNLGRVRSVDRMLIYKNGRDRLLKGRILRDIESNRYLSVATKSLNGARSAVHRLVAEAFVPNPENKPHVNHIDADPSNNRPDNLSWCTPKENVYHSFNMGHRHFNGEKAPRAKLTQAQVDMIKELYTYDKKAFNQAWLGNCFGVHRSTVGKIITGKNWIGRKSKI